MSEPGVDYTGAIAAAMQMAFADDNTASHPEYRVSPPGDTTPTSGSTLAEVTGAADVVDEGPGSPPDAAVEPAVNPVDVGTMGGAVNQWWTSPEDAISTQAMADSINSGGGGVLPDTAPGMAGWQPFPPGSDGQVVQ